MNAELDFRPTEKMYASVILTIVLTEKAKTFHRTAESKIDTRLFFHTRQSCKSTGNVWGKEILPKSTKIKKCQSTSARKSYHNMLNHLRHRVQSTQSLLSGADFQVILCDYSTFRKEVKWGWNITWRTCVARILSWLSTLPVFSSFRRRVLFTEYQWCF